jgi:hypothetical protein
MLFEMFERLVSQRWFLGQLGNRRALAFLLGAIRERGWQAMVLKRG